MLSHRRPRLSSLLKIVQVVSESRNPRSVPSPLKVTLVRLLVLPSGPRAELENMLIAIDKEPDLNPFGGNGASDRDHKGVLDHPICDAFFELALTLDKVAPY